MCPANHDLININRVVVIEWGTIIQKFFETLRRGQRKRGQRSENYDALPHNQLKEGNGMTTMRAKEPITPSRPVLRYPGGKWKLAPWILSHFPGHKVYVEPYGGAGSVLLQKKRASHGEVLNDLDEDIVTLFRVLRSPEDAKRLIREIELTPFARDEFDLSREATSDPIEKSRRFLVRSFMGQGSCILYENNGFRSKRMGCNFPSHDWMNLPPHIRTIVERLKGVVIENRPALEILERYDDPEALFYVDPPYLHGVRTDNGKKAYRHEMTDQDHIDLAMALMRLKGKVVLSGYRSTLYEDLYKGWVMFEQSARADRATLRTECLWLSPNIQRQRTLF